MSNVRNLFYGTLRRQLILGVALVHAVLMSLFIIDLVQRQEKMILEQQGDHAWSLARTLATSSAGWIASNDVAGLQELVETQRLYPELVFAILTDKQGRVLADTDKKNIGFILLDLPAEVKITELSRTTRLVDVCAPAMLSGRHVGWARVGIGQVSVHRKLERVIRDGILYALAAIVIGSILAWLMGRRVTARLDTIQETINAVKAGDNRRRVRLHGVDEAALLAGEFNRMLDALESHAAELRDINSNLERLVDVRTRQLRSTLEMVEKSELQLKMAQRVAHVGSWTIDIVNKTLEWSEETYCIFGLEPGSTISLDIFALSLHSDDRERVLAAWSASLAGEKYDIEHRIMTPEGIRWVHERAEIIFDEMGEAISGIGTVEDITGRKKAEEDREKLITELREALENIKTLKGLLPICASCKKIRNDTGYWEQIEVYIHDHSDAEFSHGICPECAEKLYPDLYKKKKG